MYNKKCWLGNWKFNNPTVREFHDQQGSLRVNAMNEKLARAAIKAGALARIGAPSDLANSVEISNLQEIGG